MIGSNPRTNQEGCCHGTGSECFQTADEEFAACRQALQALGDEARQHIILAMTRLHPCGGVRVGTIAEETHRSRPASSHHIRVLKEAGILKVRRQGTMNFYAFDRRAEALQQLEQLFAHTVSFMAQLPQDEDDFDRKNE